MASSGPKSQRKSDEPRTHGVSFVTVLGVHDHPTPEDEDKLTTSHYLTIVNKLQILCDPSAVRYLSIYVHSRNK